MRHSIVAALLAACVPACNAQPAAAPPSYGPELQGFAYPYPKP